MPQKPQHSASNVRIEILELYTRTGVIVLDPFLINMNIYENLWGDFVSCDMILNDSVNLPFHAPIIGDELLRCRFATKSLDDVDLPMMYLTSIKKRHQTKERQQIFMLHFVSSVCVHDANSTISRSFRGQAISNVVETICDDYFEGAADDLDDYNIEPTVGIDNIVIPNWKPYEALNWLAKRAVNESGASNYLFYETIGPFGAILNFKSIDSLVQQETIQNFIYSASVDDAKKLAQAVEGRVELFNLKVTSQFNIFDNIHDGYYASKLITHDIVKKKIRQSVHNLRDLYIGDIAHTDEFMPMSAEQENHELEITPRYTFAPEEGVSNNDGETLHDYHDSKIMFHPKHDRMYAKSKTDLYDNNVEKWKLSRNALIMGMNQIKLDISFPGMSFIHAGKTIHIAVPSPQKVIEENPGMVKNKDDLIDKQLSGKYLITSLKHILAMDDGTLRYMQKAQITKDAVGTAPATTQATT